MHADRPRPLVLFAIATGALIAGLAAARGLTLDERSRAEPSAIASSAQAPVVALQGAALIAEPNELDPAVDPGTEKQESPRSDQVAATTRDGDRATSAQASAKHEAAVDENAEKANAESANATRGANAAPADALQTGALRADTPQAAEAHGRVVEEMQEPPEPSVGRVASQAATTVHFERRFVAYVRCDGLPLSEGRFPCPRDPRLETQVWRVLAALEGCAIAAPARGQGELRLDFKRFGVPALHFEAVEHGPLDVEAVSKCAGPSLSQVHTSLRPDHMVVAFRFELR